MDKGNAVINVIMKINVPKALLLRFIKSRNRKLLISIKFIRYIPIYRLKIFFPRTTATE
jgi:hypothetical protein